MRSAAIFIMAGFVFLLTGCTARSLHPLFTENTLLFNPDLVGTWSDADSNMISIQKAGEKNYLVTIFHDQIDTARLTLQTGLLGKTWFLDSYPLDGPTDTPRDIHMVPAHILSRMWMYKDSLKYASLDNKHLFDLISAKKIKIPHVLLNSEIVLTASSEELQRLMLQLVQDDQAFPNASVLYRKR